MLVAAASVLLVAALVTGVGGPVGSVIALGFWLVAQWRRTGASGPETPPPPTAGASWLAWAMVVATLVVRWPIASHDVEHYPAPDEGEVVENVLEMIRMGDFDQRHPGYPGLHFYLQMLPARAHMAATGKSIPELPRSGFYLGARRLTLAAGALSVAAVFWIGSGWLPRWSAVLAAALVACSPLAFRESAVVNPDLVLTLFVCVSIGLSMRLVHARSWPAFAVAGISVGLASAIKYTGVLTVVPFSIAWLVGPSDRRPRPEAPKWLTGLALAALAFAAASPYTLLNLPAFFRGLSMHVGYYQAADLNAPLELTRQLVTRGVGFVAALAALVAMVRGLITRDARLVVLLGFPLAYWFVFSLFDRAFPRHALVLVPVVALCAADTAARLGRSMSARSRAVVGVLLLLSPVVGTVDLWRRAHRDSPADDARAWARSALPPGSRILQDQHTPSFDGDDYQVHRLRVEEKVFVGNYDWVLRSGYPPGLRTEGLREVARFENDDALGDRIVAYEVPDRAGLMPPTFRGAERTTTIGAGELPFFGGGWYPPEPGAFETSRLSRGERSEIFFTMEESATLRAELVLGAAVGQGELALEVNGTSIVELSYDEERQSHEIELSANAGLNRLELRYRETERLDRRHPDTTIRFFRMNLTRESFRSLPDRIPDAANGIRQNEVAPSR